MNTKTQTEKLRNCKGRNYKKIFLIIIMIFIITVSTLFFIEDLNYSTLNSHTQLIIQIIAMVILFLLTVISIIFFILYLDDSPIKRFRISGKIEKIIYIKGENKLGISFTDGAEFYFHGSECRVLRPGQNIEITYLEYFDHSIVLEHLKQIDS